MRAEFFVGVVVAALAHEMKIELAKKKGKGVSVEGFDGFAISGAIADAIGAGSGCGLPRFRECGFKESFGTQAACRYGFGCALQEDAGVGRARVEEANDPAVAAGMWPEEREGIGVAAREHGINLGLELR